MFLYAYFTVVRLALCSVELKTMNRIIIPFKLCLRPFIIAYTTLSGNTTWVTVDEHIIMFFIPIVNMTIWVKD